MFLHPQRISRDLFPGVIASQHVGFNLVTGFDFESVEANVEFSNVATDRVSARSEVCGDSWSQKHRQLRVG